MDKFRSYLAANYIIVQGFALIVACLLWGKAHEIPPELQEPNVPYILIGVMIFVGVLLILIKYKLSQYFYYIIDYGILFALIFIVLSVLLSDLDLPKISFLRPSTYLSATISGTVVILRHALKQFRHVAVIVITGMTAAITGFFPVYYVIVLLLLLCIFDVLVVKTDLIEPISKDIYEKGSSFIFTLKTDEGTFMIGYADIILPSMLAVSVFIQFYLREGLSQPEALLFAILGAFLTAIFVLIGLLLATRYEEVPGIPGIPYISLGIVGFLIVKLIHVLWIS
jgi:hypothetical protein